MIVTKKNLASLIGNVKFKKFNYCMQDFLLNIDKNRKQKTIPSKIFKLNRKKYFLKQP